jgi:predicted transposase
MEFFNKAYNEIAETCFEQKSDSKFNIQKLVYHHIRKKYGLLTQGNTIHSKNLQSL